MDVYKESENPNYQDPPQLSEERRERQKQLATKLQPIRKELEILHQSRMRTL